MTPTKEHSKHRVADHQHIRTLSRADVGEPLRISARNRRQAATFRHRFRGGDSAIGLELAPLIAEVDAAFEEIQNLQPRELPMGVLVPAATKQPALIAVSFNVGDVGNSTRTISLHELSPDDAGQQDARHAALVVSSRDSIVPSDNARVISLDELVPSQVLTQAPLRASDRRASSRRRREVPRALRIAELGAAQLAPQRCSEPVWDESSRDVMVREDMPARRSWRQRFTGLFGRS